MSVGTTDDRTSVRVQGTTRSSNELYSLGNLHPSRGLFTFPSNECPEGVPGAGSRSAWGSAACGRARLLFCRRGAAEGSAIGIENRSFIRLPTDCGGFKFLARRSRFGNSCRRDRIFKFGRQPSQFDECIDFRSRFNVAGRDGICGGSGSSHVGGENLIRAFVGCWMIVCDTYSWRLSVSRPRDSAWV